MPVRRSRKGKHASSAKQASVSAATTTSIPLGATGLSSSTSQQHLNFQPQSVVTCNNSSDNNQSMLHHQLILTSDKRRGVYECDYCGCDVSQTPRIRCAICIDFDVCCDCFITTDPITALSRLQTAQKAMALQNQNQQHHHDSDMMDTTTGGVGTESYIPPQHDPLTHGYRVCDSTRYPLFPINTVLTGTSTGSSSNNNYINNTTNRSNTSRKKRITKATTTTSSTADTVASSSSTIIMDGNSDDGVLSTDDVDVPDESDNNTTNINNNNNIMGVEIYDKKNGSSNDDVNVVDGGNDSKNTNVMEPIIIPAGDDIKTIWTIEEDLRLLCGIQTHGLGNWTEISDAVAGQGSYGKTPKRCMERYFDDYMGRYGYILPPYTLISEASTSTTTATTTTSSSLIENEDYDDNAMEAGTSTVVEGDSNEPDTSVTPSKDNNNNSNNNEGSTNSAALIATTSGGITSEVPSAIRSSKRRSTMFRTPGTNSNTNVPSSKKYIAVPTETLPEYQQIQIPPFIPKLKSGNVVTIGQEVGRDQATKAELAYARTIASMDSKEQVDRIRADWEMNRLNKPGGPTVLPMRPDDIPKLPGSELSGFMPRRGDFDIEHENNAEEMIADMEFIPGESEQDRNLKLAVLSIYNTKLDERSKRKQFILSRKLYDYRSYQESYKKLPRDERDLVLRMRLFERFHTPVEHNIFIHDLLKAKRLRKEIAKLQMYRRIGIRTLVEAERYEIDKARRLFHKNAIVQTNDDSIKTGGLSSSSGAAINNTAPTSTSVTAMSGPVMKPPTSTTAVSTSNDNTNTLEASSSHTAGSSSSQYWKQYRTTDRKVRRSVNRGSGGDGSIAIVADNVESSATTTSNNLVTTSTNETTTMEQGDVTTAATLNDKDDTDAMVVDEDSNPKDIGDAKSNIVNDDSNETNDDMKVETVDYDNNHNNINGTDTTSCNEIDISQLPGYNLLSVREIDLIRSLQITPQQYQQIKKVLINESIQYGLLSNDDDDDEDDNNNNDNSNINEINQNDVVSTRRNSIGTSTISTRNHNNYNNSDSNKSKSNLSLSSPLIMMDIERRDTIIYFILHAGWISKQYSTSILVNP